ncbi:MULTISPECIES: MFS transporter [Caballeronia]|uniref:MFS transporter n=1 Tax=Caballeronia jiangsuensis TaxID=1458357 RepID=A0ABW9CFY3_9BURK|nr:MFS transporter [Caballeronia sp. GaOx3]
MLTGKRESDIGSGRFAPVERPRIHWIAARVGTLGPSIAGVILYLTYWFPSRYRARIISIFLMGIPVSGWIGGPLAGWIMHDLSGLHGLRGWQLLFIYEGLPAIALGITAYFFLTNGVAQAKWLSDSEKAIVLADVQAEHVSKSESGGRVVADALPQSTILRSGLCVFLHHVRDGRDEPVGTHAHQRSGSE